MKIITIITIVATTTLVIPSLLRVETLGPLGRMSYLLLISVKHHTSQLNSLGDLEHSYMRLGCFFFWRAAIYSWWVPTLYLEVDEKSSYIYISLRCSRW
jgi:hypothetical protein